MPTEPRKGYGEQRARNRGKRFPPWDAERSTPAGILERIPRIARPGRAR